MEKSTKLIIAAVGLGGLGYFLYKKGLFSKTTTTTTEVAKDVKVDDNIVKDIVKEVVDTGKKTAVELTKDCVLEYYRCTLPTRYETIQIPIDADCGRYQPPEPPCAEPQMPNKKEYYEPIGFRDNTYNDQLYRIDYTSGKYNQEVSDFYMGRGNTYLV
jgi:hypothetical protein